MLRFRRTRALQKFVTVHASVQNHFNLERCLYSRSNFKANQAAASPSGVSFGLYKFWRSLAIWGRIELW